jgi:hypothetical protein
MNKDLRPEHKGNKNEMGQACSTYVERRGAYWVLVENPERKRPLVRPIRRWEDNIRMNLQEMGWGGGMDWTDLAQDNDRWRALVNAVMNLRGSIKWGRGFLTG